MTCTKNCATLTTRPTNPHLENSMKILFAAALLATTSAVAGAQGVYETYGDLRRDILRGTSTVDVQQTVRYSHALGYLIGVSDALTSAYVVCVPIGINKGNLARAIVHAADSEDARDGDTAAASIGSALVTVFPCSNS